MTNTFHGNIEQLTVDETNYRNVLYTSPTKNMQLVTMNIKPGTNIGMEKHDHIDQFIRFEKGTGKFIIGKEKENQIVKELYDGIAIVNS